MKQQDAAFGMLLRWTDSTTCLFWAKKHFHVEGRMLHIRTETFLGNRGRSKDRCDADVPFQLLDVSLISQLDPNCSLTNASIEMDQKPEDSYPNTFVPGRNMVFLLSPLSWPVVREFIIW